MKTKHEALFACIKFWLALNAGGLARWILGALYVFCIPHLCIVFRNIYLSLKAVKLRVVLMGDPPPNLIIVTEPSGSIKLSPVNDSNGSPSSVTTMVLQSSVKCSMSGSNPTGRKKICRPIKDKNEILCKVQEGVWRCRVWVCVCVWGCVCVCMWVSWCFNNACLPGYSWNIFQS